MKSTLSASARPWWRRGLLDVAIFVAVLAAVTVWQTRDLVGGTAPPIAGLSAMGQPLTLEAARMQAAGKPVLVHFWASWCGVCALVDDSIDALAEDWPVLSVAYQSGGPAEIAAHLRTEGLTFDAVADPQGRVGDAYGVTAVPTSFIVDADGQIRFRTVGYTTGWGLRLRLWLVDSF